MSLKKEAYPLSGYRPLSLFSLMLLGLVLIPALSRAQLPEFGGPAGLAAPSVHRDPGTVAGESTGYLFNFTGLGAKFGRSMADRGLYFHGDTQNDAVSVLAGGAKGGSNYVGLGYWGFDLDTKKAFGLPGGLFDVTFSTQIGNTSGIDSAVGSQGYVPWALGNGARLVNFDYTQSFLNHAIQITFGRIEAGYTTTPYLSPGINHPFWYCLFFSTSCGNTAAFAFDSSKAPYPVGSWGGFITLHPAPFWYVKGGVYENQPIEVTTQNNLGWPGADWGFNQASGAFFPIQVGYVTTPLSSLFPTNVYAGGYYDSAGFPDKFYNSRGLPTPTHPGAPLIDHGADGIFVGIQQKVLRFSSNRKSNRGLSFFFSGEWDLSANETARQQYYAGFIVQGPFAFRSADSLNFLVSGETFDPRLIADREAVAAVHHLNYRMQPQIGLELNYQFAIAPGLTVQPFAQYIIHPDQLTLTVPNPENTHVLVVGIRTVLRFENLLGLIQPGASG